MILWKGKSNGLRMALKQQRMAAWWNGRHKGLKIPWGVSPVRVRVPPRLMQKERPQADWRRPTQLGPLVFLTSEPAGYFTPAVVAFSSQHFAFGAAQQSGAAVDGDVSSSWQHAAAASEQQAGMDAEPGQHEPSLQRSPFDQ